MESHVACPHCGEPNAPGSNICGRCMRDIRDVANPDRMAFEQTAKKLTPKRTWWRLIRYWWQNRRRD